MGILDKPLLNVVSTVLSKVGGTCVLKQINRGAYDPLAGDAEPALPTTWSLPCSPPYPFKKSLVDGKAVQQGDFQLIVSVAKASPAVVPDVHMQVQRNGRYYSIVSVEPINSGDQDVAYILHCRG